VLPANQVRARSRRDGWSVRRRNARGRQRPLCSRSLQLAGDGAERGTEVSTDQGERRNGCDRDQRGNQRVLDRRDARLIVDKI